MKTTRLNRQWLREECFEWRFVALISFLLNVIAYIGYMVHATYAVDDYGAILSSSGTIVSGRWVIDFVHEIVCRKSLIPTIGPIFCMTLYVLSGIGLCKLWGIRKNLAILVISLFSMHPYLQDVYNVRFAALSLALGFFAMIVAVHLSTKGITGMISAVMLTYLALSTYQPVLGLAVAAVMFQVLLICYRGHFSSESIRKCGRLLVRYFIVLLLSVIAYVILTKTIFEVFDVPMNPRIEAGFISTMDQLRAKIAVVGSVLFVRLGPVKEYVLPFAGKLAIFMIYILAVVGIVFKKAYGIGRIWALLWVALIPLGAICFILPLEVLAIPWRICLGLVVFFVGMFVLTQESDSLLIRRAGQVLGWFLVVYFILNNNAILYQQYLINQKDVFMGNRMIAKIQSLEGYQPRMKLAIVGRTEKESFSKEGKSDVEIIQEYIKHTSVRRYSLARSAFETDWSKYAFLLYYMDLELHKCTSESLAKACIASKDKQPWPDPSSVFIQDDTVVVVLALPKD